MRFNKEVISNNEVRVYSFKDALSDKGVYAIWSVEIEKVISLQISQDIVKSSLYIEKKVHKRVNKNAPQNMDLNLKSYQYFEGIDLMSIEGVSHSTIMAILSEVGPEGFKKFQTAKQFTSWLRLCPNNKISVERY